ncbi:bifunctional folylpolyglutamate synthase/dihydrofolate synthase [Eubacteriales bacterium OttesenSCG-928-A19]|nr:bifunctional folylpolyglutamate synthase/dihydrofolate synthase [Eubacteriales bacterium OttesenSCG-928-A19]
MKMTYEGALAYIHGAHRTGKKNGLENMAHLLGLLGDPHRALRAIHVAGTNGKGSVCAFVEAGLRRAGYRTGLYTSPFLQRYNERMRVDGMPIADDTLAELTGRVAEAAETLAARDIFPTEFELGTAIAFLYLAEACVDIAVIEVGLGGRLDPTNVLHPMICAIAAIGLDHTGILGDTPVQIAREKAGIAKRGVPMLVSAQNTEPVLSVIRRECEAVGAPMAVAEPVRDVSLGLRGAHQAFNAGLAVAVLQAADRAGLAVPEDAIALGLREARWPGRLEWIEGSPPYLLDGAHNEQGVLSLKAYAQSLPSRETVLICGILRDKDWRTMARSLADIADRVITVRVDNLKAVPAEVLAQAFMDAGKRADPAPSVREALADAASIAGMSGRVLIAGSLYLVGEARTLLLGMESSMNQ